MKKLILIRHGETSFLRENPGSPLVNDASLTDTGCEQIAAVGALLKNEAPGVILTSTLKRAVESAQILTEQFKVEIVKTPDLNEFAVNEDGTGTETTESGLVRASTALNMVRKAHDCVLVVGHNSLLTLLMSSILNSPYSPSESQFQKPGSHHILSYNWEAGETHWELVQD